VIAMPSERWGERPLLVVVPKAAGTAGAQAVTSVLRQLTAAFSTS
jgi:acyl-CoA synthetase (AMP-forming)/AMP-acid ligase II